MFNFTSFGVFLLRLISKLNILAAFKHLLIFLPKIAKHYVTKTPFSQKISPPIFLTFWWQTSNWFWGRYWKFRVDIFCRFWAIEKIRQEGNICPPPSGARVKFQINPSRNFRENDVLLTSCFDILGKKSKRLKAARMFSFEARRNRKHKTAQNWTLYKTALSDSVYFFRFWPLKFKVSIFQK